MKIANEFIGTLRGLTPEIDLGLVGKLDELEEFISTKGGVNAIFVVGCPRSGTTLLANILGSHSELVNGDESLFLLDHWNMFSKYVLGENRRRSDYLRSFTTKEESLTHFRNFAQGFFNDLKQSKLSAKFVVEHTPVYGLIAPFLELLFENPSYIHITRNQRDVVKSLERVRSKGALWGQDDLDSRRLFHRFWLDVSRSLEGKVPGRYTEISYETLVDDPERTLQPFLNKVGLQWESSMSDALSVRYAQA